MYAAGSFAFGAYDPAVSDLDVIAVVRDPLDRETKERLVDALRHETIPCPARGLELVVYARDAVATPSPDPGYELDLNSGASMPFRASFDDSDADRHWYVVDRAIVREHGIPLAGPPASELFAPIPRPILLGALAESIEWHRAADEPPTNAVLNACRALRYAEDGVWTSKDAAARWVDTDLARDALAARAGGAPPDRPRVDAFLAEALGRLRAGAVAYPPVKRLEDKVVAMLLLTLTLPASAVAFAAVALDALLCAQDRGPILYRERRVSRGRQFDLLKFRTLRRGALATQEGGEAHARALEADPANLTWAGRRVLKPWYLDELPQLLHVLRGDLSLVGPRPWPPSMVEDQVARGLDYRNHVIAGWTGPAQVSKDVTEPHGDAVLDLAYLEACRTWTPARLLRYDLGILWRTVKVLARGEGLRY